MKYPGVVLGFVVEMSYENKRHSCKVVSNRCCSFAPKDSDENQKCDIRLTGAKITQLSFKNKLDTSRRLSSDKCCSICAMRNLIWVMCRLRTAVLKRRKLKDDNRIMGQQQTPNEFEIA